MKRKANGETSYSSKVAILADFWMNYRNHDDFSDFVRYNDVGLPIAYSLHQEFVLRTDVSDKFVDETFVLLLAGLDVEDSGFETLDEILNAHQDN